jgi:hypothetical protein
MPPIAVGTNPFDDDAEISFRVSTNVNSSNPFDADTSIELSVNPAGADDDLIHDDLDDHPVEASWQYLGDLPYRRIPIYSNVRWGDTDNEFGLSSFPPNFQQQLQRSDLMDARDVHELLTTSTVTKVAGCPHGGPIATVTLPILGGAMKTCELRIMTNAGAPLASIDIPPKHINRAYSASDVMTIGFTNRSMLIVLLRDSLCLTYDLQGEPVLPPFHVLPSGEGKGTELLQATIFEGGVAVLSLECIQPLSSCSMRSDDPSYANSAHLGARRISPSMNNSVAVQPRGKCLEN